MENNMNTLEKKIMDKENNLRAKLNKLNDNVEKINKYNKKKYLDSIRNLDNGVRQLENELKQNNNLSDVRRGKIEKDIKELTEYKNKYEEFLDNIDEIIKNVEDIDEKQDSISINIEKRYGKDFFNFLKSIIEGKNISYPEEEYADMPYLDTEEEAAENIADKNEQRDVRKKDNKARTFAPSDNTEEAAKNIADISEIDLNEIDNLISDINDYSHNNNNSNNNNNNNNNNKVKISEGEYINFSDLVKFLNDIKMVRLIIQI